MSAPDTSFMPPPPRSAERPGTDEHEHPSGWGLPPESGARGFGELAPVTFGFAPIEQGAAQPAPY